MGVDGAPVTQFDLLDFLPYQLAAASERVSREFADLYRRKFGISVAEWRVLAHLNQSGEVSVRDIETRVGMEKSKVSRAVSRLEAAGLVLKRVNPADRRLLSLTLTGDGRDLIGRIVPLALEFQARLADRLGSDAAVLSRALQTIVRGGE